MRQIKYENFMSDNVENLELPVSVVIATLGGDTLSDTLERLNCGTKLPAEILICIPEEYLDNVAEVTTFPNINIIKTDCRGQVAQRAVGLEMAKYDFVMQCDDDVILPPDTLEGLFNTLREKGPGNVVAPFFRIQGSGVDGTRYVVGIKGFLTDIYFALICGASFGKKRFGRIASSGVGFGVLMGTESERLIESEWLPGGVVMCCRGDLITDNYYPFSGKAFSEDLMHSILWRKRGCRLWTLLDVSAMVDVTAESFSKVSLVGRYMAHAYVAKLGDGSVWRTRLWFFFYCLLNMRKIIADNQRHK